ATTGLLGVGRDYIGKDYMAYTWDFTVTPRYAFVNTAKDQVYVNAAVGVQVELTNSDTTPLEHEWLWKDTLVGVGWAHTVYESKDKEWVNTPGISLSALLPTSKASSSEGKYFQSSLGVSDRALVKLRGSKKDWFPNVLVIGAASWQHLFAKSYDPTNANAAEVPRQNAVGLSTLDDQLSMSSFNMDQVKLSFIYYLTIWKDLSFGNVVGVTMPFKHSWSNGVCVNTSTGCVGPSENLPGAVNATTGVPVTTFDVSLSYNLFDLGRIDVGYNNETPELVNGNRESFFYSQQSAQFYLDFVGYLDAIYDKTAEKLKKKSATANLPHHGIDF
ncbi:MAG TPA: hypothetical protein VHB21_23980, partial [Minicystis sp.]|nr:hypothetical protein [Minicystis sp.]